MSAPRVAVVITFYKDDRFFPQALQSVLSQTRPPDEIVVVDDASPPGTNQTLEGLDSRVRVLRRPVNGGPGAARQTGSDAATGELICYLDADDVWLTNKLERQLADFSVHPELTAHHVGMTMFRADGSETSFTAKPLRLDLATQLRRNQAMPSGYLIRRSALMAVGGWSTDTAIMEDWDLNIRLVAAGHQVGFLPEALVRFRRTNQGNLSARGLRHMAFNMKTVWVHNRLFRHELGLSGTAAVMGRVLHDEGSRRGRATGLMLRLAGRVLGHPGARR